MHRRVNDQEARYRSAAEEFGPAIGRLVRACEADRDLRRDLEQEIHLALWRSLSAFDGRCSLRTWVFRVAHNVAASHACRGRRAGRGVRLDAVAEPTDPTDTEADLDARLRLQRLHGLLAELAAPDRQLMLLYLEDLDAAAIGEVVGLTPGAVAARIHRLKQALARRFAEGTTP